MARLKFREVAEKAGVSIGAVQKAIKYGYLDKSLDEVQVEIWIRGRAEKAKVKMAEEKIEEKWMQALEWQLAEMTENPPQGPKQLVELNNQTVGVFLEGLKDIERDFLYSWSENIYQEQPVVLESLHSEIDPDEVATVHVRLDFCVYMGARVKMRGLLDEWVERAKKSNRKFPTVNKIIKMTNLRSFKQFRQSFETLQ
ncbi:MAG: hypothetical protein R3F54_14445 [Alphaproteobacteria bacterium]